MQGRQSLNASETGNFITVEIALLLQKTTPALGLSETWAERSIWS